MTGPARPLALCESAVALPGPGVLALVGDETGCTLWRIYWPFTWLEAHGYPAYWCPQEDKLAPLVMQGANPSGRPLEAVLLPRLYWPPADQDRAARWIGDLHQAGHAVLAEWDDDVLSEACLPQTMLLEPDRTRADLDAERQARLYALSLMDGITVSTPRLATVVRQYVRPDVPVTVVPNRLDWAWFQRVAAQAPPRTDPRVTIGWAGGRRLDADLTEMAGAWGRIARRYPDVQFKVVGWTPGVWEPTPLLEAVPPDRLSGTPWQPLGNYPVALQHIDIGCCPLADNPFNRSKSACKALEWGAVGAAVVYSPTVYGRELRDRRDGLQAATAAEWEAALAWLLDHPTERRALGRRWARRVQARYTLQADAHRWAAAWAAGVAAYQARRPRLVAV